MDNKKVKDFLIWILPAILLIWAVLPIPHIPFFGLILKTGVTVCAGFIIYYLTKTKPKHYIPWIVGFAFIIAFYNPVLRIGMPAFLAVPLTITAAIAFVANWYFVFKTRT